MSSREWSLNTSLSQKRRGTRLYQPQNAIRKMTDITLSLFYREIKDKLCGFVFVHKDQYTRERHVHIQQKGEGGWGREDKAIFYAFQEVLNELSAQFF